MRPVAVETEPIHGAAGTEGQRVTCFVDDASKGVGARYSGQSVLRTVAPVDQVGQIALREKDKEREKPQHNIRLSLQNKQQHNKRDNSKLSVEIQCMKCLLQRMQ